MLTQNLTKIEQRIYLLVCEEALSYREITTLLGLSGETVKHYMQNIRDKKGMDTTLGLVVQYYKDHLPSAIEVNREFVLRECKDLLEEVSAALNVIRRTLL